MGSQGGTLEAMRTQESTLEVMGSQGGTLEAMRTQRGTLEVMGSQGGALEAMRTQDADPKILRDKVVNCLVELVEMAFEKMVGSVNDFQLFRLR